MPETVADPLSSCCPSLFFGPGIQESQLLDPDPCLARDRPRAHARPVAWHLQTLSDF
jgi:hypothetical protein